MLCLYKHDSVILKKQFLLQRCYHHYDKKCHTDYDISYDVRYEKECHTTHRPECRQIQHTVYVEKCDYRSEQKCDIVYATIQEEKCEIKYDTKCFTHYETVYDSAQ